MWDAPAAGTSDRENIAVAIIGAPDYDVVVFTIGQIVAVTVDPTATHAIVNSDLGIVVPGKRQGQANTGQREVGVVPNNIAVRDIDWVAGKRLVIVRSSPPVKQIQIAQMRSEV